ncbi:MAG TPA: hypothetical protein VMJ11_21445 [Paraburkholderia sp.]|nr:hypothetical protein [Paraburkholderia sp.]
MAFASVSSNFAALPVSLNTLAAGAATFNAFTSAAPSSPIATSETASQRPEAPVRLLIDRRALIGRQRSELLRTRLDIGFRGFAQFRQWVVQRESFANRTRPLGSTSSRTKGLELALVLRAEFGRPSIDDCVGVVAVSWRACGF